MNYTTYMHFRGDYYEITYTLDGTIVEILVYFQHGHIPELVPYTALDASTRNRIDDVVCFALNHNAYVTPRPF